MGRLGYPCVTILVERTPFLRDRSADLCACVGRAGGSRGPSDRNQVCGVMSPELPEAEIRRIVRERLREGVLRKAPTALPEARTDRKSTRLNSSHLGISYAVFCLKK